jgi:hypothetical protein
MNAACAPRTVLLVGFGADAATRLAAGLNALGFVCESVPFDEGFELLEVVPFDAVVTVFPFPREVPMTRFMMRLRKHSSACQHAALVILTDEFSRPEAEALRGRGANLVFPVSVEASELAAALGAVTAAAVRVPLVTLVQLELATAGGVRRVAAQCENVSETGMFVRLGQAVPIGTTVGFELVLPGEGYRLRGQGSVVRHGIGSRQGQLGVALRFAALDEDSRYRLKHFIEHHGGEPPAGGRLWRGRG